MPSNPKPLVLFFIERDCPCSREAAPFLDQIQTTYGEAVTVVGMINADADAAKEWTDQVGVQFTIIPDPTMAIITAFGARRSPHVTLVAPGGRTVSTYAGFSGQVLDEVANAIAVLIDVAPKPIAFRGAPERLRPGCEFPAASIVAAAD